MTFPRCFHSITLLTAYRPHLPQRRRQPAAAHRRRCTLSLLHLARISAIGFANIETALRLLEVPTSLLSDLPENARVSVVDTSFMYETAPMYVTDQPPFA
ncbi:hypothetical protein JVU11DRAFT_9802 [Chiua virens]|nr:hypothetical protein JVU11DRAFT_9802 [Chiua virens]